MKNIILCLAVLAVCIIAGWLITKLIKKHFKSLHFKGNTFVGTLLCTVALLMIFALIYLNTYYPAGDIAAEAMKGTTEVSVSHIKDGYYFDGPGDDTALIFYPGAKVATEAYAPLMLVLAENGLDCFLTEMPFHMAVFGSNRALTFMERYTYDCWIIGGHSMGGAFSTSFAGANSEKVQGVVLLGAYPVTRLDDSVRLLSIYGTKDTVISKSNYNSSREKWPKDAMELIIEGGNHAQFGDYGMQKGDTPADISFEKQMDLTSEAIISWNAIRQ